MSYKHGKVLIIPCYARGNLKAIPEGLGVRWEVVTSIFTGNLRGIIPSNILLTFSSLGCSLGCSFGCSFYSIVKYSVHNCK